MALRMRPVSTLLCHWPCTRHLGLVVLLCPPALSLSTISLAISLALRKAKGESRTRMAKGEPNPKFFLKSSVVNMARGTSAMHVSAHVQIAGYQMRVSATKIRNSTFRNIVKLKKQMLEHV